MQNMLSKLDCADTHSRVKSLMSDVTNCGARITCKLEGVFTDMELSSINVEKPSSEEEVNTQHDIDKDKVVDDADEAPTVEDFHKLVPTKTWKVESRKVRRGGYRPLHV